ncbi:MAG: cupredoxin domain-containing protein [bacterium]|nr:cupredoxin domain-containing protein [bacterium]
MNNNAIVTLLIVIAVIIGGFFLYQKYADRPSAVRDATTDVTAQGGATSTDTGLVADDELEVKEFTVTGKPFSLTPNTITVDRGDRVRIVFKNEQGTHDFVIDEFDVRTPVIGAGKSATIEFTAGSAGTYDYYCSVGNHRAQGMEGAFIVR